MCSTTPRYNCVHICKLMYNTHSVNTSSMCVSRPIIRILSVVYLFFSKQFRLLMFEPFIGNVFITSPFEFPMSPKSYNEMHREMLVEQEEHKNWHEYLTRKVNSWLSNRTLRKLSQVVWINSLCWFNRYFALTFSVYMLWGGIALRLGTLSRKLFLLLDNSAKFTDEHAL